jgi:hypothetical protein
MDATMAQIALRLFNYALLQLRFLSLRRAGRREK